MYRKKLVESDIIYEEKVKMGKKKFDGLFNRQRVSISIFFESKSALSKLF